MQISVTNLMLNTAYTTWDIYVQNSVTDGDDPAKQIILSEAIR